MTILEAGGRTIQAAQPADPDERVRLCLRPEDVSVFPGEPKKATGDFNRLGGQVVRLVPAGGWLRVTVDCGFPLVGLVSSRGAEEMGLAEGMTVTAHFKVTAPHLLRGW
jgi:ABC-type molybdate transport system ATPase subunit